MGSIGLIQDTGDPASVCRSLFLFLFLSLLPHRKSNVGTCTVNRVQVLLFDCLIISCRSLSELPDGNGDNNR